VFFDDKASLVYYERFKHPITEPLLLEKGVSHFCWICPEDRDSKKNIIAEHGAFLYWHTFENKEFTYLFRVSNNLVPFVEALIYIWEWQDKTCWCSFDVTSNLKLEEAMSKGIDTIDLELTAGQYTVSLKRMCQINRKTKFERPIRRFLATSTRDAHKWEFVLKKAWTPYDIPSSVSLERHYIDALTGKSTEAKIPIITTKGGKTELTTYEINYKTMKQTSPDAHFREIRRKVDLGVPIYDRQPANDLQIQQFLQQRIASVNRSPVPIEKLRPCTGVLTITVGGAKT